MRLPRVAFALVMTTAVVLGGGGCGATAARPTTTATAATAPATSTSSPTAPASAAAVRDPACPMRTSVISSPPLAQATIGKQVWQVEPPAAGSVQLVIRRSTDGGRTFHPVSVTLPAGTEAVSTACLSFADGQHGWLLLPGGAATAQGLWILLNTADGGRTWRVEAHTDFSQPDAGGFLGWAYGVTAMRFLSTSQGWIVAVNPWTSPPAVDVWRTVDGGRHWTDFRVPLPSGTVDQIRAIGAPVFTSSQTGSFAVRLRSRVIAYATSDAGATWIQAH